MTTAKSSRAAQLKAAQLTAENASRGLFAVEVKAWDQIVELLNQYPEVARILYPDVGDDTVERLEKAAEKVETAVAVIIEARSEGSVLPTERSFDDEIDEARGSLEDHEYEVAEHSLVKMRERLWDQLSPRQRFRVLSNLAMAKLARGDSAKAASLFIEAKTHQPEDQVACENEAFACQLLGQHEEAYSKAIAIRRKFPSAGRATAIWVRESPSTMKAEELEHETPTQLRNHPEVALAIAQRALSDSDFDRAEKYSRAALENSHNKSFALWLLGQSILSDEMTRSWKQHADYLPPNDPTRLREAETCFSKAVDAAALEKSRETAVNALLGRSFVKEQLKDLDGAEADLEAAYRMDAQHRAALVRYGALLDKRGDSKSAVKLLRAAAGSGAGEEAKFLLLVALRHREQGSDLTEAIQLVSEFVATHESLPPGLRENAILSGFDALKKAGRLSEGEKLLESIPEGVISKIGIATIRSRLLNSPW